MENSFKITGVRNIMNGKTQGFFLDLVDAKGAPVKEIFRPVKMMLIDLQNSGRAMQINRGTFDIGWDNAHGEARVQMMKELTKIIGSTLYGDTTITVPGDTYLIRENHPALTNVNHPLFGVKTGDTAIVQKGAHLVEGFLRIPVTREELMIEEISKSEAGAKAMLDRLFGTINIPAPAITVPEPKAVAIPNVSPTDAFDNFEEYEEETEEIATKTKATKAPAMKDALGN